MAHIKVQPPLNSNAFLENVEINSDEINSYEIDLWSDDGTFVEIDVVKGRPDWVTAFWVSVDTPSTKPQGRKFNLTHRSGYSLKINGNDLEIWAFKASKVITLLTRIPGKTYYLNIQNREGTDNFYFLRVTIPA